MLTGTLLCDETTRSGRHTGYVKIAPRTGRGMPLACWLVVCRTFRRDLSQDIRSCSAWLGHSTSENARRLAVLVVGCRVNLARTLATACDAPSPDGCMTID